VLDTPVPTMAVDTVPSLGTTSSGTGAFVNVPALVGQALQALVSALAAAASSFFGTNPAPSTPGVSVAFSGQASWLARLFSATLGLVRSLGLDAQATTTIVATSPPALVTQGLTVTQTVYEGMVVYELSVSDLSAVSGKYVVAIHGGGYVDEATVAHWWSYAEMVRSTGATVIVPIYSLAPEGTAATVVPLIADLISSTVAGYGTDNVSVIGDSAGGGLALSAVQLLVREHRAVPSSLVLQSPWLDVTMTNPGIASINDPILDLAQTLKNGSLWAGDLDPTDPLVSPLYGSLEGLPPTYVYAGSEELLAPDILVLQEKAIAANAHVSFTLRTGEIHDWALLPFFDGAAVQPQIYAQLGLIESTAVL